jgi:concentrative nucleoside transporter, CNT family
MATRPNPISLRSSPACSGKLADVMNTEPNTQTPSSSPQPTPLPSGTPMRWRLYIAAGLGLILLLAYVFQPTIGVRGQAFCGIFFFFGFVALFSTNLKAVNWQTIGFGILLQFALASLVLYSPHVYRAFEGIGGVVKSFITFSDAGAKFVFGNLADNRLPKEGGTWQSLFG